MKILNFTIVNFFIFLEEASIIKSINVRVYNNNDKENGVSFQIEILYRGYNLNKAKNNVTDKTIYLFIRRFFNEKDDH